MRQEFRPSSKTPRFLFSLGLLYLLIGGIALVAYILRDIVGIEIGVHGSLITLGLLAIVGIGLLLMGWVQPRE